MNGSKIQKMDIKKPVKTVWALKKGFLKTKNPNLKSKLKIKNQKLKS